MNSKNVLESVNMQFLRERVTKVIVPELGVSRLEGKVQEDNETLEMGQLLVIPHSVYE